MKKIPRIISMAISISIIFGLLFGTVPALASDSSTCAHARPSINGQLSVEGTQLVDQQGNPVKLRGISAHGLPWFPDFVNDHIFKQLSEEWDCNLVRLPMYSEVYCEDSTEPSFSLINSGIDLAIANDMYVIADWHILKDYDPNMHADEAAAFFDEISRKYAQVPNIIYEICNEPNQETSWSDIYAYSSKIIPIIRSNSPDAVILVGTANYDRELIQAARKPLPFDDVMYVLHFYAATHKEDLQAELEEALARNLPVFVSECGISESTGDGYADFESARSWFNLLDDNNISYAVWSLSNKDETSAMLYPDYDPFSPITDEYLTPTGLWVKALIQGQNPSEIPVLVEPRKRSILPAWLSQSLSHNDVAILEAWPKAAAFVIIGEIAACVLIVLFITFNKNKTYNDIARMGEAPKISTKERIIVWAKRLVLFLSVFFTTLYLYWRIAYSIPIENGPLAICANIILLIVEIFGFIESLILYGHLMGMKKYPLPNIKDDEFPDVDIFIATYNEPADLLRKTINACNHLKYPDKSKIHVWLCDDNRRAEMRQLAQSMGIGYFDRPDNSGAKAGNLNNALGRTNAPYVVTLDADMIVKSDFLLKTIPYFVDAEKKCANMPQEQKISLGILQTPQCFYEPDIYQHSLYSDKTAPNEQDFFYRTIETAKTSSNSVIYGGSNTVISRKALKAIGGFYTETITEDFATGMLIESHGFVSLALPEPLASGKTPDTFKEHIKQRIRWGRGVISTARQLHLFRRRGLSLAQRLSYWSSVVYWYSPVKNLIYILSPLVFAVFAIPVFNCSWSNLLLFWLPMYLVQDQCLRAHSKNAVSLKWSGIYETSVMPFLLVPIIKEFFGITTKKFAVTDKSRKLGKSRTDVRSMVPFLILIGLSVIGILRVLTIIRGWQSLGLVILLFWIIRNLYFLIMSLFLVDGRDLDIDEVHVVDAEMVQITKKTGGMPLDGITTFLTEHSMKVFLDESGALNIGDKVVANVGLGEGEAVLDCAVTGITPSRTGVSAVYTIEILDYNGTENDYLQILFDRIPTLPQSLRRDYGILIHLLINIAHRILR